ncbi:hypothetical protein H9L19_02030 [Weissella diestrammenae]|uniref:Oligosaccharide flippase family protein n=1 Tax=Weissella diestrammenae TaxID=1162633 RepID=A0A7G9T6F1_9LACO|nr:hypothetical protein [Weissella diestrammenae]MCM0583277.1 hypothetical protein [Weissella diestrammenae]QNN75676.1 hypothetical protein H9L19_02030 [Weissella diestrammenae]
MKGQFFRNFIYGTLPNFIYALLQFVILLIIPNLISVKNYGLYQIYMFYMSYITLMQFGWSEGMYVNYGGLTYRQLDRRSIASQFKVFSGWTIFVAVLMILIGELFFKSDMAFIVVALGIATLLTNLRNYANNILLATSRIAAFSLINVFGTTVNLGLVLLLLAVQQITYQTVIIANLMAILVSLMSLLFKTRDVLFSKPQVVVPWQTIKHHLRRGSKILFASLSTIIIIGIIRFFIQQAWDTATFARISLPLSFSNIMMLFISSLALLVFPSLNRQNHQIILNGFKVLQLGIKLILLSGLLAFFPLRVMIDHLIPKYTSSIQYMAIIFPAVFFQAKFEILNTTFMKILGLEIALVKINLVSFAISFGLGVISVYGYHNLMLAIASIIVVMATKSILGDYYLHTKMKFSLVSQTLPEIIVVVLFIICASMSNVVIGFLSYLAIVLVLIWQKRQIIRDMYVNMRQ